MTSLLRSPLALRVVPLVAVMGLLGAVAALPANATTDAKAFHGLVMLKYTDRNGRFQDFRLQVGRTSYTVVTNFYDGSAPLTRVVNLDGKESPVQFIQVGNFVNVTGTIRHAKILGSTVIRASVVQVLTHKDRGA